MVCNGCRIDLHKIHCSKSTDYCSFKLNELKLKLGTALSIPGGIADYFFVAITRCVCRIWQKITVFLSFFFPLLLVSLLSFSIIWYIFDFFFFVVYLFEKERVFLSAGSGDERNPRRSTFNPKTETFPMQKPKFWP